MTEEERIDRFEAAYNRIDHAITDLLDAEKASRRGHSSRNHRKHGFAARVRVLANHRRRYARYADFLLEIGELRNAVVHSRTGDDFYLAVPNEQTVLDLERIEQRLLAPERVIPRFQKVVLTVSPDDSLAMTWEKVRETGYSRFPVYGPEGFIGLLTSNGFARYIGKQLKKDRLELDAGAVRIEDVLEQDHRRDRVAFVERDTLIDDVDDMFSRRAPEPPLEAVLITEHGRPQERPIGLISPTDIAALKD